MKKKLRKKYSTGGVVNTTPPVTDVQKKKFNTSATNALAYMSSRLDNPEYFKRLSNELVESNKLGNVQYDLTNGAAKQLEQRKKGLQSAKIIQPDTKDPNELAVLNNLQQLGYLGIFDTGRIGRYEPELQTQGFMKGAYAQPNVEYEQSYVGMSPKTLDLPDNVLENLILHEGGGHAIQQPFEGYTNPLFPAGMIPTPQGDKVLYRNKSNLTPYALKTIKDNILSTNEYYSNPDEIMASKLQVEHLLEKAPKGTFKKEWKYGDALEDEHFNYFLDDKNKHQNLILKNALLGDKKLENLTEDEKKDLKTRFSNIMMKLAQQEQVNPLGIQTAAYGGIMGDPVDPEQERLAFEQRKKQFLKEHARDLERERIKKNWTKNMKFIEGTSIPVEFSDSYQNFVNQDSSVKGNEDYTQQFFEFDRKQYEDRILQGLNPNPKTHPLDESIRAGILKSRETSYNMITPYSENMKKKNKNIQLPQMGFGGQLAPMLFDIGSNALMNLTSYAVTDLVKAIKEPEQERRPTKMNTGFVMANGGMVPNIPVEVEGGEHYELPNGQVGQFQGPSHEQGGMPTALPEGTKVYSDRIEIKGKTMSERKSLRERNIAKMEKLLGKNPSDKILKETYKRVKETAEMEEQQDMTLQEQVNQQQAQQEQQMMAGLMQDPAMMEQMGMMMYGGKLGGGTPPSGVKMYSGFGSYPTYIYQHNPDTKQWAYYNPGNPSKGWINVDPKKDASAFNTLNSKVLDNEKYRYLKSVHAPEIPQTYLDLGENNGLNIPVENYTFNNGNPNITAPQGSPMGIYGLQNPPMTENEALLLGRQMSAYDKKVNEEKNKYADVKGTNPPQPQIGTNQGMKVAGEWTEGPDTEPLFPFVMGGREKGTKATTLLGKASEGAGLKQQTPLIHQNINSPYDLMSYMMMQGLQNPEMFGYNPEAAGTNAGKILGEAVLNPTTGTTVPTGKDGKKQNTLNKLAQALTGSGDKTSTAGGNKDGKAGDKKVNTSPSEYDFTRGDLMGLAGNFIGGIGPMAMTFMNRMMTPPEKNHYREYGAKGMKAIEEGQSMLGSVYNQQKDSIKLGEEASRKRGRATARGVNTLRGLDTVADMTSNQAYNQAAANYMGQLLGIFGQKSQQGNLMDQMFMTGEEKKAENILKNLDNFYTNLNEDTSNIATRTMAAGKYLNDAKKNKDLMALSKYYSKYGIGARYGKNGELELYHVNSDKPATETEIKKAEEEIKKENKEEVNPIMPMGFISPYQSYNFGDATMGKISPIRKTKKGSK